MILGVCDTPRNRGFGTTEEVEGERERFYHFQLIDLYTHNFAYVGILTTGNGAGKFLIAGPGWDGVKPQGITEVIRSETDFIFNVTRTQLFGPDDLEKVTEIQGNYGLLPLSGFLGTGAPRAEAVPDFPEWVKEGFGEIEKFIGEHSNGPLASGKMFGTRTFLNESAKTNYGEREGRFAGSAYCQGFAGG